MAACGGEAEGSALTRGRKEAGSGLLMGAAQG
jgi:hypothetical protein